MTTTNTITDHQISCLRAEAARAGDSLQVALCEIALGNAEWSDDTWLQVNTCLDGYERRELVNHTVQSARAECERVIRDAEAQ